MPKTLLDAFKPKPIKRQIALYVAWKATRYPVAASNHERVLIEFFRKSRITCVTALSADMVDAYIQSQSSMYFKEHIVHVLRQFFKYWIEMGLLVEEFEEKIPKELVIEPKEPTMNIEQTIRVQKLTKPKGEGGLGLSLRQAQLRMETEDGRMYHLKQIHRWSRYKVPEVIPTTPLGRRQ